MTVLGFDGVLKMWGMGCFAVQLRFLLITYSFYPLSKKFSFEFKEAYLLHISGWRELIYPYMQIYIFYSEIITYVVVK